MSGTLTNAIRDRIKRKTREAFYEPRRAEIEKRLTEAVTGYFSTSAADPALLYALDLVNDNGFVKKVSDVRISVPGFLTSFELSEPVFCRLDLLNRWIDCIILDDSALKRAPALLEDLKPIFRDYQKFEREWETLRNEINGVLQSVTTIKKLVAAWPEVLEIDPELNEKAQTTALVVNTVELNRKIEAFKAKS